MNTDKALMMYALLEGMCETMDDERTSQLLDWVDGLVRKLRAGDTFARVALDLRTGGCDEALEEMDSNAREIERACNLRPQEADHESLMWIAALNITASIQDFRMLLAGTCFFIAAQESGIHRVGNDRMRLALTYLYMRLLKKLA